LTNVRNHGQRDANFILENCAISYSGGKVSIRITGNNTETKITDSNSVSAGGQSVSVPARTLDSIVKEHNLRGFTLVCDIEGAEIDVLLNETECLSQCNALFIELHDTRSGEKKYSVDDLVRIITEKHHFAIAHSHSPVFYFVKNG
jgi:FkbM family methyltransferase